MRGNICLYAGAHPFANPINDTAAAQDYPHVSHARRPDRCVLRHTVRLA